MSRVVFVFLLLIVAPLAQAKTWFVATNGRDSNRGGVYKGVVRIESPDEYRIAAGSPCVNAGTKMPTVTTDYRDKPRGAKTDIGAIELSTE